MSIKSENQLLQDEIRGVSLTTAIIQAGPAGISLREMSTGQGWTAAQAQRAVAAMRAGEVGAQVVYSDGRFYWMPADAETGRRRDRDGTEG